MRTSESRGTTGVCGLFMVMALVAGCGGWVGHGDTYVRRWSPRWKVNQEATFRVGLPPDEWRPAKQKGAQVLWIHEAVPALIHVTAQCEMHGDSSLESFTDHLRIDFRAWEVVEQKSEVVAGRDALRSIVLAEIDGGVATKMELLVFKKNGCLFDMQYIAPPSHFERGRAAFQQVVAGFSFPVER
ncbi:MAG: hypothetical protein IPK80_31785 [Nannocystis sp.]|nr:hypothetical protein [Nannocystis sp.]